MPRPTVSRPATMPKPVKVRLRGRGPAPARIDRGLLLHRPPPADRLAPDRQRQRLSQPLPQLAMLTQLSQQRMRLRLTGRTLDDQRLICQQRRQRVDLVEVAVWMVLYGVLLVISSILLSREAQLSASGLWTT